MARKKNFERDEIRELARRGLSRFDGQLSRFDGESQYPAAYNGGYPDAYDGGDGVLHFAGSPLEFEGYSGKAAPGQMDRRKFFRFRLTPAVDDAVYLSPGMLAGTQGVITDGSFTMIGGGTCVGLCLTTGSGTKSIKQYIEWARLHAHEIVGMKLQVSSAAGAAQLNNSMTAIFVTPFDGDPATQPYHPSLASDQNTFNPLERIFNTPGLVSTDEVLIKYPLTKDIAVDITLFCGTAWNPANLVAKMAMQNPASIGRR